MFSIFSFSFYSVKSSKYKKCTWNVSDYNYLNIQLGHVHDMPVFMVYIVITEGGGGAVFIELFDVFCLQRPAIITFFLGGGGGGEKDIKKKRQDTSSIAPWRFLRFWIVLAWQRFHKSRGKSRKETVLFWRIFYPVLNSKFSSPGFLIFTLELHML